MQLKFEQVGRQKRRKKTLAKLQVQLKKDNEEHALPSGQLNADTGKLWSLRDASPQDLLGISVPIFPEIVGITNSKDMRMLTE